MRLQALRYLAAMRSTGRDYTSAAERVAWALDHCGRSASEVAHDMGCTHSTLSQWRHGKTNLHKCKAELLLAFARATGVSVDWLLTGDGPRLNLRAQQPVSPLLTQAQRIAVERPDLEALATRVLEALVEGEPAEAE